MRSAQRNKEQKSRAHCIAGVACEQNFAAVEAIGYVSRNEKQKYARKKLCETDEPQIEVPVGDFVDLPTHGHRLHFDCNHAGPAGGNEKPEVRTLKRSAAGVSG